MPVLCGEALLQERVDQHDLDVQEEGGAEASGQEQPHQTGTSLSFLPDRNRARRRQQA
jgi:hypothetical protein